MAINLRLSPQEDQLLERYCGLTRRTKTDVIRELVRGLKIVEDPLGVVDMPEANEVGWRLEQKIIDLTSQSTLLPPGWKYDPDFKCFEGEYKGTFVSIEQGKGGFIIDIDGDSPATIQGDNVLTAIALAQIVIDDLSDED